ncbi:hypothetical protein F2Q69_00002341 [Brassica cretica]|uniref:Uncharacterized protein n=1 Tax=Brassica cretica TaxID=69181 RepID=A0A8S9P0K0_BRACR|nr:hypothetical protein F2Q69_00002341 [Brassica cretica]
MECNSSDLNVSRQKRQRTEDDKTRSAMLDFSVLDCPICMEPLSIPTFQMNNSDNCLVPREYSEEELLLEERKRLLYVNSHRPQESLLEESIVCYIVEKM